MQRINLGAGTNKFKDCINADSFGLPDLVMDLKKPFPLESGVFDEVYLFHTIEHIEKKYWPITLGEIRRILTEEGTVFISYPEFAKIAQNWLINYRGMREFWEHTIYGRQSHEGDNHVSLMDSDQFTEVLYFIGFTNVTVRPEEGESYNTIVTASPGKVPPYYEQVLFNEVFA